MNSFSEKSRSRHPVVGQDGNSIAAIGATATTAANVRIPRGTRPPHAQRNTHQPQR